MEAGYQVGTLTIVDVLDFTTTLYNAKRQLSDARYTYLINQLNIKSALGTLNQNDLLLLNGALGKPVSTAPHRRRAAESRAGRLCGRLSGQCADATNCGAGIGGHCASAPAVTTSQPARNSGNPFRN